MSPSPKPLTLSLFNLLREQIGESVPVIRCTKAMLVHLSHSLEDMVLAEKLPSLIFTGFQESAHWVKETQRYRELAAIAQQITIFAGKPLPQECEASQLHIELSSDDPLKQEWFLLILSDRFSVLLSGQDVGTSVEEEAYREFDTFWTFDINIIGCVLDMIEDVVAQYRPERLYDIQAGRQRFSLHPPDVDLITQLTINFARYEEDLTRRLNWQRMLTDTLLKSIPYHLYVTDLHADGTVETRYISPNIESLTGYPKEEIGDAWVFWLERGVIPEDHAHLQTQPQWMKSGGFGVREYRFLHAEGEVIWIKDSMHVEYDPETGNRTVYGVMEDISADKRAEQIRLEQERLRVELEKERELSQLKSYFMRNISHEFRTPLSVILTASDTLLRFFDRMDDPQKLSKLNIIADSVSHLRRMLNDVNDVVNNNVFKLGFSPESADVVKLALKTMHECEMVDEVGHQYQFVAENPSVEAKVDIKLVRQIMINLLSNAAKYSPPDTPIKVTVDENDDSVILSVTDSGIGIANDDQQRIFDAFFRGSNVATIHGLGLGLRIVLDCVELHQGIVKFHSVLNQGTTFTVYLPRNPQSMSAGC